MVSAYVSWPVNFKCPWVVIWDITVLGSTVLWKLNMAYSNLLMLLPTLDLSCMCEHTDSPQITRVCCTKSTWLYIHIKHDLVYWLNILQLAGVYSAEFAKKNTLCLTSIQYMFRDILQFDRTLQDAVHRISTAHRTCDLIVGVGDGKVGYRHCL